jgi:hypothetical protein
VVRAREICANCGWKVLDAHGFLGTAINDGNSPKSTPYSPTKGPSQRTFRSKGLDTSKAVDRGQEGHQKRKQQATSTEHHGED